MRTRLLPFAVALTLSVSTPALVGTADAAPDAAPQAAPTAAAPVHQISIDGTGVEMYPAFKPGVERYGITTTDATAGRVTVTATTSDTKGRVLINGRPTKGSRTLGGLEEGDEISVIFEDSGGRSAHSLIHLPADMHPLTRTGNVMPDEHTLLGQGLWGDGTPFYEIAVDGNGVPVAVHREETSSMDFKRQPNGELSVSRGSATSPGHQGSAVVSLADDLSETDRSETVGLVNTDGHDSILLPDGSKYFVAYESNAGTGLTDAVIQHVNASGEVLFEWNSGDHVDPATETVIGGGNPDYAHINSIQVMDDGDILASFRHFSAVFKIARHAHDGFDEGEVVWKFGGRFSDFDFVNDEHAGPCAQHTASELDNGHLLMFDNGSWNWNGAHPLCIDPADPTGDTIPRMPTRITEYDIDEVTHEATLVWEYEYPGRFAIFAGSAERLPNGNTLIGWASSRDAVVSEVDPDHEIVWELTDASETDQNKRQFTYRAHRTTIKDIEAPTAALAGPKNGASYPQGKSVAITPTCSDRGGSSLQQCTLTGTRDGRLDTTTPGRHTARLTAVDGAGHRVVRTVNYVVSPALPDAQVRRAAGQRWVGVGIRGSVTRQSVNQPLTRKKPRRTGQVRIVNNGAKAYRFKVKGTAGNARFRVEYFLGKRRVTKAVTAGRFKTPAVAPGKATVLRVRTVRTKRADRGDRRKVVVRATSTFAKPRKDAVRFVVRAR